MKTAATAIRKINRYAKEELITETTRKNAIAYIKTFSEDVYKITVNINRYGAVFVDTFDHLGDVIAKRVMLNEHIYYTYY